MTGFLRKLRLLHLIVVCAGFVGAGAGAGAIASALTTSSPPPAEPLAVAVHDALVAPPVEGISAQIQFVNRLFEGANLAGGAGSSSSSALASSPLLTGASGRLWIARDGRVRIELQSAQGDTEVLLDHGAVSALVPSSQGPDLYRFNPAADHSGSPTVGAPAGDAPAAPSVPSMAKVEGAIAHLERDAIVSGAQPGVVAGRPAYTVRLSPRERGSLLGGVALTWDAVHGVPLRGAVYAAGDPVPVIELDATEVTYGPVERSVFEISPPPGTKVIEPQREGRQAAGSATPQPGGVEPGEGPPGAGVHAIGHGVGTILALRAPAHRTSLTESSQLAGTQKVTVDGAQGRALVTALGTVLSFERDGVAHLLLGAVSLADVQRAAEGL